ncbi:MULTISPECIES: hypothetical protein [unclassified Pseudomonas]|uniref:hypothetical protein n=1 Tax=unclassified Pseudomonas TaxID=196821 RepID=UPI001F57D1B8|nr:MULTISPECIES: hypothetical protein [unclassified Pseudomonas]
MSKVLSDQEAAWIGFASAALNGYLASGKYDSNAAMKAAEQADKLLEEFEGRVKAANGK